MTLPSKFGCTNREDLKISGKCKKNNEIFLENVCFKLIFAGKKLNLNEMEKKCSSLNYTLADLPLINTKSLSIIFSWLFISLNDELFTNIPWPIYGKFLT